MKNFKQLKIWQKGLEIATKMYALVGHFPEQEKFGLSSQLTRAAVSIPLLRRVVVVAAKKIMYGS